MSKPSDMLPIKVVLGMALQLGFAVATTTVVLVYGGHWLDQKLGTEYWFWIGIVLGLVGSLYLVWQIVKPLRANADFESLKK